MPQLYNSLQLLYEYLRSQVNNGTSTCNKVKTFNILIHIYTGSMPEQINITNFDTKYLQQKLYDKVSE